MTSAVLGATLVVACVVMVFAAAAVYGITGLGPLWVVPMAAGRATAQLAAVSVVLAAAVTRLWSSFLMLAVMFVVATFTAARRSQADRGLTWIGVSLAAGLCVTVPPLILTGLVPLKGVAIVPMAGIVLGATMTGVAVAARRSLDDLALRVGEVEAALSLV